MKTYKRIEGSSELMVVNRRTGEKFCVEQLEPEGEETFEIDCTVLSKKDQVIFRMLLNSGVKIKTITPPPQQPSDSAGEELSDKVKIARLADSYAEKHSDDLPRQVDLFDGFAAGFKACLKLTRPTVSEGEILRKAIEAEREENPYTDSKSVYVRGELRREYVHAYQVGFKAAIKQLLNR